MKNLASRFSMFQRTRCEVARAAALVLAVVALLPQSALARPKFACRGDKPVGAFVGQMGKYKFTRGLVSHEDDAILKRRQVTPTEGCLFAGLAPSDHLIVYYKKPKDGFRSFVIQAQCVNADNPSESIDGIDLGLSEATGYEVLLACGSSEKYECADTDVGGLNSAFHDRLEEKGQMAFEFVFPDGTAMGEKAWRALAGKTVFCQYWDEETNKVFVAVEWKVPGP